MTKTTLTKYSEMGSNNPDGEERHTILEQTKLESDDSDSAAKEYEIKFSTPYGVTFTKFN